MSERVERPIVVGGQLAYNLQQAAAMMGVSVAHFNKHIRPELQMPLFSGSRILFPHADLAEWVETQRQHRVQWVIPLHDDGSDWLPEDGPPNGTN